MTNSYCYQSSNGTRKGAFNIFQGRAGGIFLTMGKRHILLTIEQVNHLGLDLMGLIDFNHDDYLTYYKLKQITDETIS